MDQLASVRHRQGRLLGRTASLGFDRTNEALLNTTTEDAVKSCEIEGESLDTARVHPSVTRCLDLDVGGVVDFEAHVEGVVEITLDAEGKTTPSP